MICNNVLDMRNTLYRTNLKTEEDLKEKRYEEKY
jgi:hypothetical protein